MNSWLSRLIQSWTFDALQVCVWLLDPTEDVTVVTASVPPASLVSVRPSSVRFNASDWAPGDAACQYFTITPGEMCGRHAPIKPFCVDFALRCGECWFTFIEGA